MSQPKQIKITAAEAKKALSEQLRIIQDNCLTLGRLSESLDRTLKIGDINFTIAEDVRLAEKNLKDCQKAVLQIKKTTIARIRARASEL